MLEMDGLYNLFGDFLFSGWKNFWLIVIGVFIYFSSYCFTQ